MPKRSVAVQRWNIIEFGCKINQKKGLFVPYSSLWNL